MLKGHKEQLSSLMDGNQIDAQVIDSVVGDEELKQSWYRYHVARDVMQGRLYSSVLTWDISNKVASAIDLEELFNQEKANQVSPSRLARNFWPKTKDAVSKLSQVGLAACVTLGIIAGVQYHQQSSVNNDASPVLNTVPIGVNVSPVGGIATGQNQTQQDTAESEEYSKIRFLIQDYELRKRLNVQQ
ncbi:RseA family anti-sigma factor [Orbus sturtevantii]|uniref:RseA family anti-sigma factor n=1 Tax=Orbus sturtevantii TaxID=3074109 RepID=UPI00370D362F